MNQRPPIFLAGISPVLHNARIVFSDRGIRSAASFGDRYSILLMSSPCFLWVRAGIPAGLTSQCAVLTEGEVTAPMPDYPGHQRTIFTGNRQTQDLRRPAGFDACMTINDQRWIYTRWSPSTSRNPHYGNCGSRTHSVCTLSPRSPYCGCGASYHAVFRFTVSIRWFPDFIGARILTASNSY